MRTIKERHLGISTILAFALIPLSGLATDVYIPSLPSMAQNLHVGNGAVQFTLVMFMVSYGIGQLFVGSFLDSFGRYRLSLTSIAIFSVASFCIAFSHNLGLIYAMRIVQGITVALIAIGKRAFFVDMYSGDKLRGHVSMFSIIWATAPIVAPFIGGYLQSAFGWQSNFMFLGFFSLLMLILELVWSGESLAQSQPFRLRPIARIYVDMMKTADFSLALFILAACYACLVVFGMASPFIIEHVFNHSPVVTGYCALLSGASLMTGGIISKSMLHRPLNKKIPLAMSIQFVFAVSMVIVSRYVTNLYTFMPFVLVIHLVGGFVFNNLFSYCLGRFTKNAAIASGIVGGGLFVIASILSYGMVHLMSIKSATLLGTAYLSFSVFSLVMFYVFTRAREKELGTLRFSKAA